MRSIRLPKLLNDDDASVRFGLNPSLSQSTTTKIPDMEHNEGRELVEYALIAILVAAGVTLMLSGAGDQIAYVWNAAASFVIR